MKIIVTLAAEMENGLKGLEIPNECFVRIKFESMETTLDSIKLIDLPKIEDPRGNLTFIEEESHIPFEIKRTYWIYDVPGGQIRGGHAFKEQQELIVALSGSFDVIVDDGRQKQTYSLNRSYYGLYVPKGLWREMNNFSTNSLAMVLSSTFYNEDDYIRKYQDYQIWLKK